MNVFKSMRIGMVILLVLQIAIFSGCSQYKELTNDPPEIAAFTVPTEVEYGETVKFSVRSFDPEDDDLTYVWDVSDGTLVGDTSAVVQWTAPELPPEEMVPPKVVTVTVSVRDGGEEDVTKSASITVYSKPYRIAETLSGTYRLVSKSVNGDPVEVAGTLRLTPTTFTREVQDLLEGVQGQTRFVTGTYKLIKPYRESSGTIHWFAHGVPRPSVSRYTWDGKFFVLVLPATSTQYVYSRSGADPVEDIKEEDVEPEPIEEDVEPELIDPAEPIEEDVAPEPEGMTLITEGEFEMGSETALANTDEHPIHTVWTSAFYIDTHEVTVGAYRQFVQETGHRAPDWAQITRYAPTDEHPIVLVSWHDAMAYAKWAGKRLPTEAEWEKAARGGHIQRTYPWGDTAPDGTQCNFADKNLKRYWWADKDADDDYAYTAPVENYLENEYGLYDMAGNVAEWCLDEYDADFYAVSPHKNPFSGIDTLEEIMETFSSVQSLRVLRGGSWLVNAQGVRSAARFRLHPSHTNSSVGFRCAKDLPF